MGVRASRRLLLGSRGTVGRQPGQPHLGSRSQDVRGHRCRVHGNSSDIFKIGFSLGILPFDLIVSNCSSPSGAPSFAAPSFGGDFPCRSCHFPRYDTRYCRCSLTLGLNKPNDPSPKRVRCSNLKANTTIG